MILYYIYISYLKRCLSIIFYPSTDWSVFLSALPPLHPSIHPSVVWRLPACPCGWFFRLYTQPMYVRTCMRIIIMNAYIYYIYIHIRIHTQVQTSIENYEMWNHFYSRHDKTHMAWYHWDSLPCQALSLQTFPLARSPGRSNQCQRVNPSPSHCI